MLGRRRGALGRERRVELRHVHDGLRVLALADGQVERLRVASSPFGPYL